MEASHDGMLWKEKVNVGEGRLKRGDVFMFEGGGGGGIHFVNLGIFFLKGVLFYDF